MYLDRDRNLRRDDRGGHHRNGARALAGDPAGIVTVALGRGARARTGDSCSGRRRRADSICARTAAPQSPGAQAHPAPDDSRRSRTRRRTFMGRAFSFRRDADALDRHATARRVVDPSRSLLGHLTSQSQCLRGRPADARARRAGRTRRRDTTAANRRQRPDGARLARSPAPAVRHVHRCRQRLGWHRRAGAASEQAPACRGSRAPTPSALW